MMSKRDKLLHILQEMSGVAVAFSGGVDSALVAYAAHRALGDRAIAVTADSASVPRSELLAAKQFADTMGFQHIIEKTDEFSNPDYLKNDGSRCYFCKSELYARIVQKLPELGVNIICSGANLDDLGDYRPGLVAAAENAVRHPLQEAGFTKADVRALALEWQLPVWDKPASPCLSSRLAPGLAVTPERTLRVELAEEFLKAHGLRDCRVRHHEGDLARIEVPVTEIARFAQEPLCSQVTTRLRELGFRFVTLDLEGFRTGSLNALITLDVKSRYTPQPTDPTASRS
jgi:pyridinium-3,5-biscarboxylic acid mononucleotide sulfurtransferase